MIVAVAHSSPGTETHVHVRARIATMTMTPISSPIGHINRWAREEIVTLPITVENREVPTTLIPANGPEEIVDGFIQCVLPIKQDEAQIRVTVVPITAVAVRRSSDAHQIVEVDLISPVILFGGQIQLIGHLIRQEPGTLPRFLVVHGPPHRDGQQRGQQDKHITLHSNVFLRRTNCAFYLKRTFT